MMGGRTHKIDGAAVGIDLAGGLVVDVALDLQRAAVEDASRMLTAPSRPFSMAMAPVLRISVPPIASIRPSFCSVRLVIEPKPVI